MVAPWKKSYGQPRQHIKKQRYYFADKGPSSQSYGFSSSHVWMWELDYKESWVPKNWCFWTVVLENTLESPLDSKEIKPVNSKGNKPWIVTGRTNAEAEAPTLWLSDAKNWLRWKRPWFWERLKAGEEGDDKGWDGWMASPTQWMWVWASSESCWWTRKPGVLQSMGSQRVRHDWATELNWKGSWDCFSTGSVAGNYGVPQVVSVSRRSLDGGIVVREPTHPAPSQPCIIPQGGHGGFPHSHHRFENGQAGYFLLIPRSIFHSSLLCSVLREADLYRLYHQGSLAGRDGFSQWEDQRQEEKEVGASPHPLSFLDSMATASTRGCSSRLPLFLGYNGLGVVATSSYCYSLGTAASLNLTQTWVNTHSWNSLLPARPLKVQ